MTATIRTVEVRVLDGPNLYFTRPAVKLTLAPVAWLRMPVRRTAELAGRTGFASTSPPGTPESEERRRFVARLTVHLVRSLAHAMETALAVRARPAPEADQIVVAFPWR